MAIMNIKNKLICVFFVVSLCLNRCDHQMTLSVEPLLCDTSIEGTQDLVLEKCSHNHCICYL